MLCYVGVVLGVSPMPEPVRSRLHGPWCRVGVHCVICVGCPGPWILVRKVLCAQVMLLVGDGVVQSRRIHDVVQGLVVTEVLFGLGLELEQ